MGNRKQRNSKQRSNTSSASLDIALVGTRADDHVILSDLTYKPVPPVYSAKPPRQLLNQIFFARQSTFATITSSNTLPVEANLSFSAADDMEQYGAYLSIFDQYYLHSAVVTITNEFHVSSATAFTYPVVHTAIDFDNVTNLTTIAAIESYGTHNVDVLTPGKSVTRIILPCNNSNGNNVSGNVTRMWVPSAQTNARFFGFRSITENASGSGSILNVHISCIWAFRNTI